VALEAGDLITACNSLQSFINEVLAQSGKKIPSADAAALIAEAMGIREEIGC
jgi:hypothetical protein